MWRQILSFLLAIFVTACGAGGGVYYGTYKPPGTAERGESTLAIFDWSACKHWWVVSCGVSVQRLPDGKLPAGPKALDMEDSRKISRMVLEPGTYSVWVGWLSGGFMEPDVSGTKISGTFEMEAGRKYVVKEDQWSTGGLWGPYVDSWWIEDAETGEVMAGAPPPENLRWYQDTPL